MRSVDSAQKTEFRPDINGLRAWAVMAVLAFHLKLPFLPGGFVGVDVFFVISGFLMTGIIIRGLEQGGFSVLGFYAARARRIVPALLVLCLVMVVLGWFFLVPGDYRMLGQHSVLSLLFLSNVKFWREAGYFDASAHDKFLLHTWSLSAEWQFYLIFPVVLVAIWRFFPSRRAAAGWMLAGLAASLAASHWMVTRDASFGFYMLPTRMWEMLAGGLVSLAPAAWAGASAHVRQALHWTGFSMIVFALVAFDSTTPWPGTLAIVPVLGTSLVILSGIGSRWLTTHGVAQWIGDRSYSIYLWHWPVVVILSWLGLLGGWASVLVCLPLSLFLGHLSFRWVEGPARRMLQSGSGARKAGSIAVLGLVMSMAGLVYVRDGYPGIRLPLQVELAALEGENSHPRRPACQVKAGSNAPMCVHGSGPLGMVVLGDSHANTLVSVLQEIADSRGVSVLEFSYTSCPPYFGVRQVPGRLWPGYACAEYMEGVLEELKAIPAGVPVLVASRWAFYMHGEGMSVEESRREPPSHFLTQVYPARSVEYVRELQDAMVHSLCRIAEGRRISALAPIPEMPEDVPHALGRRAALGFPGSPVVSIGEYSQRNAAAIAALSRAEKTCGVQLLDPTTALCRSGKCPGFSGGRPLYYDGDHLSEFGNKRLVKVLELAFSRETLPLK